ncbi:hypothetical protein GCM10023215_29970 [Pseudonocardia yuanmonensis]|uniref:Enoyl-ACP reductase-like protein n=1 Tax=Pseudonocardia yuanmonensis TaxID=1095914 RepID=A0ABP8WKY3_9PSEU
MLTEQSAALNSDSYKEEVLSRVQSNRLGVRDDVSSAVAFLLSDEASWINGQVLPVNGGRGLG